MTIRVVTDSTCDLPRQIVRDHNITVIPLIITADAKELRDGVDISPGEFYAQLPDFRHSPKTAAPGPDVFRRTYETPGRGGRRPDPLNPHFTEAQPDHRERTPGRGGHEGGRSH